jgi:hypothetical protein
MQRNFRLSLFFLLFAAKLLAQTNIASLESALKGKQLWLRNYSADAVVQYEWQNGGLVNQPVKLHTLGVFTLESAKLNHNKLILVGNCSTVVRDSSQKSKFFLTYKSPMKLEVNLNQSTPESLLPQIEPLLFFSSMQEAQENLPAPFTKLPLDIKPTSGLLETQNILLDGHWTDVPASAVTLPKLIHNEEPEITDHAKQAKANGSVTLIFTVDDKGHVDNFWLAMPFAYGLNESAFNAAREYVFQPAIYQTKPVGSRIFIKFNFKSK